MESPDIDTGEFLRQKDEIGEKRDEFMCKYLRRAWPVRLVCILGIVQLVISLAMLGVDLPVILMFAPRWQVFAGCWAFIFALVAAASTLHSLRKLTWSKLQWAVGLNVLGGLAAALMIAFNMIFAVNPKTCVIVGGCNYLSYTYARAPSFYAGEIVLGIAFMISVYVFLILFIKYGVGGTVLFTSILDGFSTSDYDNMIPSDGRRTAAGPPAAGPGVRMVGKSVAPMLTQQYPMGPRGPMMSGPRGPMLMTPRGPMPTNYRQPMPYPPNGYPQAPPTANGYPQNPYPPTTRGSQR